MKEKEFENIIDKMINISIITKLLNLNIIDEVQFDKLKEKIDKFYKTCTENN